jgi:fructosamine-3-kinase
LLLRLAEHLNEHQPCPALVHGDLWGGNAASLSDGRGSIFDPASWWADREVDLAMTRLFGGFSEAFRSGYRDVLPDAPGADGRVEIYNLYHLLNHANLFGGSYLSQCRASLKDLARRL